MEDGRGCTAYCWVCYQVCCALDVGLFRQDVCEDEESTRVILVIELQDFGKTKQKYIKIN